MEINEEFLYFLWEDIIPDLKNLTTTSGKKITVINPGFKNRGTGPDYFNAQIKIDALRWAGNVEIHTHSSDWLLHHHQHDAAYQNIILHVVWKCDGSEIENLFDTLEISKFIPEELIINKNKLSGTIGTELPCDAFHTKISESKASQTLEKMSAERMMERTVLLEKKFIYFQYNWQQLFYSVILESFGFHINALPMFRLSQTVNVNILIKESGSLFRIYALLTGASSLLYEMHPTDERKNLINEFEYLKNKHQVEPLPEGSFKLHGIRPPNHPLVRLAQFSFLFFNLNELFQTLNFPTSKNDFMKLLEKSFKVCKEHKPPLRYFLPPGKNSIRLILINAWCLFLFFRGIKTNHEELKKLALEILESLPAESNHKTRLFRKLPLHVTNALISQGMIHLYNEYCRNKKCMLCEFGKEIMKKDFF